MHAMLSDVSRKFHFISPTGPLRHETHTERPRRARESMPNREKACGIEYFHFFLPELFITDRLDSTFGSHPRVRILLSVVDTGLALSVCLHQLNDQISPATSQKPLSSLMAAGPLPAIFPNINFSQTTPHISKTSKSTGRSPSWTVFEFTQKHTHTYIYGACELLAQNVPVVIGSLNPPEGRGEGRGEKAGLNSPP